MIEHVEHFRAKLELHRLGEEKIFQNRKIKVIGSRADKNISSGITEGVEGRSLESSSVEPTLHAPLRRRQFDIAGHDVRALRAATKHASVCSFHTHNLHGEGIATGKRG